MPVLKKFQFFYLSSRIDRRSVCPQSPRSLVSAWDEESGRSFLSLSLTSLIHSLLSQRKYLRDHNLSFRTVSCTCLLGCLDNSPTSLGCLTLRPHQAEGQERDLGIFPSRCFFPCYCVCLCVCPAGSVSLASLPVDSR